MKYLLIPIMLVAGYVTAQQSTLDKCLENSVDPAGYAQCYIDAGYSH